MEGAGDQIHVGQQRPLRCSILSYAAKYASAYYGPFREAAESHHSRVTVAATKWIRECRGSDARGFVHIEEGADAVMVKPAGPYLDIVSRVKAVTATQWQRIR